MTVQEALEEFILAARADGLSKPTVRWYRAILTTMASAWQDRQVGEVGPSDVRRWIVALEDRGLSEESVKSHKRAILRFWKWCAAEFNITNPTAGIKHPGISRGDPNKAIAQDDLKKMVKVAIEGAPTLHRINHLRDLAILILLIDTGVRAGAVLSVDVKDINLDSRYVVVTDKRKNRNVNIRRVRISQNAVPFLKTWLNERPKCDSQAAFPSFVKGHVRGRLTYSGLYGLLKRMARRAGVSGKFNPHSFRHNFGQRYLLSGGDLASASQLLGHASIQITADVYSQFRSDDLGSQLDKHTPLKDAI